jgi:hypothetical protein
MPYYNTPASHAIWVRIAGAIPLARSTTSFALTTSRRLLSSHSRAILLKSYDDVPEDVRE